MVCLGISLTPMSKSRDSKGEASTGTGNSKESAPGDSGMGHAADEAVKAALDMAQSVGSEKSNTESSLLFGFGEYGDTVSISQYIEEAEERAQSLFAQANSDDEGPLEDLDVLDVAAEFGRPDESTDEPDGTEVSVENRLALEETQNLAMTAVRLNESGASDQGSGRENRNESAPPLNIREGGHDDTWKLQSVRPSRRRFRGPGAHGGGRQRLSTEANRDGVEIGTSVAPLSGGTGNLSRKIILEKLARIEEGTYYEILNVPPDASFDEIHRAFSREMQLFEEERFLQEPHVAYAEHGRLIRRILVEALDVLTAPELREQYGRAIEIRSCKQ